MSVFNDQRIFMAACGQTTTTLDDEQTELYLGLGLDELAETLVAINPKAAAEINDLVGALKDFVRIDPYEANHVLLFDGLLDVITCFAGAGVSANLPMDAGWATVTNANMRKIDPATGQVTRREDGKILKPEGWIAPDETLRKLATGEINAL
jgi:predicted HAD superfamily Cof-like phosphohydrolase